MFKAVVKSGYMLGNPSIRRYPPRHHKGLVTMRPVRIISRKDQGPIVQIKALGILRDHTPDPQTERAGRYGPICMATCRGRQK